MPGHRKGFHIRDGSVVLEWGGYPYHIEAKRIDTPEKLLGWVAHIGGKNWEDMTPARIAELIEVVAARRGWNIYEL